MRPAMRSMLGVVLVTLCCGRLAAEEAKSSWWPFGAKEEVAAAPPVTTTPPAATQTTAPAVESESAIKWPSMPKIDWPSFTLKERDAEAAAVGEVTPSLTAPTTPTAPSTATVPPVAAAPAIAGVATQPPITPVTEPDAKPRRTPRFGKAAQDPRRNSWATTTTPKEPGPSPWESMKNGARRMSDSTVAAWHKTVDAVTPGDSDAVTTPSVSSPVAQQKPEKSWWNWWGSGDAEPEGPRTVTEWMAQDRLDP